MENMPHRRRSIFGPILLIILGLVLFLGNLNILPGNLWDIGLRLWPLLLIAGGLDSLYRREGGWVGSLLVIGLGTLFLLGNLGMLMLNGWELLTYLWPVLIIAVGLDILIGRRSTWGAVVGLVLGLALIAGLLWFATNLNPQGYSSVKLEQSLDNAQQAELNFSATTGKFELESGAAAANLLEGQIRYPRGGQTQHSYVVENGTGQFNMESNSGSFGPFESTSGRMNFDLQINGATPAGLKLEMGVGEQSLDLRNTKVEQLDLKSGVGRIQLILPESGKLQVTMENGVGETIIYISRDARVELNVDTGITGVEIPAGYERDGDRIYRSGGGSADMNLTVQQAIGRIAIRYTP